MSGKPVGRPRIHAEKLRPKSITMTAAKWDRLRAIAYRERCSVSELLRRAAKAIV